MKNVLNEHDTSDNFESEINVTNTELKAVNDLDK